MDQITRGNKKLRILHITSEYPPVNNGGQAYAIAQLVNASISAGMTTDVIHIIQMNTKDYGFYKSNCDYIKINQKVKHPILEPKVFDISNAINECLEAINTWKPDLIHLHVYSLLPIARAIKEKTNIPIVYTVHTLEREEREENFGSPLESLLRPRIQEQLIHIADRILVLSHKDCELLSKYCSSISNKIRIVGNGINYNDIENYKDRKKFETRTSSKVVLFVGRLANRKGIQDLVAAIPDVLAEIPNTRFAFIGGRPGKSVTDTRRHYLNSISSKCHKNIIFTGWLSDTELVKWYQHADILVLPSRYEPFGLVILEAMLHGLPIIASAVGGPLEILEDERTALLFPARNFQALSILYRYLWDIL